MIHLIKKVASLLITILLLATSLATSLSGAPFAKAKGVDPEEKVYYYLHDHLGGVDAVLDEEGEVVERRDYLPYGSERLTEGATDESYGFTGKELDEETGLYYYGARYYDPVVGRFVAPDPVFLGEAEKTEKKTEDLLTEPQRLNPYTYANNNPLKYIDDTGEIAILPAVIFGASLISAFLSSYQNVAAPAPDSPRIHTKTENEIIGSMVIGEMVGGAFGYGAGKIATGIAKFGFKTIDELKLYRQLLKNGKGVKEAAEQAKQSVNRNLEKVKGRIKEYLGEDMKMGKKKNSNDKYFISSDDSRKIRFDIDNSHGDKPHMHIEEKTSGGNWNDATNEHRIYPKEED